MSWERLKDEIDRVIEVLECGSKKERIQAAQTLGIIGKNRFPDEETTERILMALVRRTMIDRSKKVRKKAVCSIQLVKTTWKTEKEQRTLRLEEIKARTRENAIACINEPDGREVLLMEPESGVAKYGK